MSLEHFIECFYCSMAFTPERVVLKLLGSPAARSDARALARGETERFGVWKVIERQERQALLESRSTGTASWFCVEPNGEATCLLFGSWVRNLRQSGWKSFEDPHRWYSEVLLGGVRL